MKKKRENKVERIWGEKGRGEMTEEGRGKGEADQSKSRRSLRLSLSPTSSRKADRRNGDPVDGDGKKKKELAVEL
jgi:hypothetical protein